MENKLQQEQYSYPNLDNYQRYVSGIDPYKNDNDATWEALKNQPIHKQEEFFNQNRETINKSFKERVDKFYSKCSLPPNYTYKPLPEGLCIKDSRIEGSGLFTNKSIVAYTDLGHTHIKFEDQLIRTPLGGFINHAVEANCVITNFGRLDKPYYHLMTLRQIEVGEELTANYFLSACGNEVLNQGK